MILCVDTTKYNYLSCDQQNSIKYVYRKIIFSVHYIIIVSAENRFSIILLVKPADCVVV